MSPELRILTCSLLEKMKQNQEYAKRLGIADNSKILFQGSKEEMYPEKSRKKG